MFFFGQVSLHKYVGYRKIFSNITVFYERVQVVEKFIISNLLLKSIKKLF